MTSYLPMVIQYGGAVGAGMILFAFAFEKVYRVVRPTSTTDESVTTLAAIRQLCGAVEKLDSSVTELRVEVAKLSGRME